MYMLREGHGKSHVGGGERAALSVWRDGSATSLPTSSPNRPSF